MVVARSDALPRETATSVTMAVTATEEQLMSLLPVPAVFFANILVSLQMEGTGRDHQPSNFSEMHLLPLKRGLASNSHTWVAGHCDDLRRGLV